MKVKKWVLTTSCFLIGILALFIISHRGQSLNKLSPHFIKIPNGKIEYYKFGKGPPLILITGYLSNIKSWNIPLLKILAKEHEVIIYDNRNVGGSHFKSDSYSSFDLAQDTNFLIEKLNFHQVDVVGISMGGIIAQQLAILYPQKIQHLILINTVIAGVNPISPSAKVAEALMHPPHDLLNRYLLALDILFPPSARFNMFFRLWYDRFSPHYKEASISPKIAKQQIALVFNWTKNIHAFKELHSLTMPILILSGGADQVIPPQNSDVLLQQLPHARMIRLTSGGHAMIFQYPNEIGNAINGFIKKDGF